MTLEQQVTSLELSRRLKELGVKQESLFWWHTHEDPQVPQHTDYVFANWENCKWDVAFCDKVSAFTVTELGEMLQLDKCEWLVCSKDPISKEFCMTYMKQIAKADTEANARAKMLIYLIENNLLTH